MTALQKYLNQKLNADCDVTVQTWNNELLNSGIIIYCARDEERSVFMHDRGSSMPNCRGVWDTKNLKDIPIEEIGKVWNFSQKLTVDNVCLLMKTLFGNDVIQSSYEVENAKTAYGGNGKWVEAPCLDVDNRKMDYWQQTGVTQCGVNFASSTVVLPGAVSDGIKFERSKGLF